MTDAGRPLVVLDITEGVVQGEYTYPGTGMPIVLTLDFDRDEADLEELTRFRATVEEACVAIEGRTDHPDDLAQLVEWRQHADDLIGNAGACPYCGSTDTVELSRDEQLITICAQCGAD